MLKESLGIPVMNRILCTYISYLQALVIIRNRGPAFTGTYGFAETLHPYGNKGCVPEGNYTEHLIT